MSAIYTVSETNLTLGAAGVLFALQTAAAETTRAGRIAIRRVELGIDLTTMTAEMIPGAIALRTTGGTLTMVGATPKPISPASVAGTPTSGIASSTAPNATPGSCGINASVDSGGTYTNLYPFVFHNMNGWLYIPTPTDVIEVAPSTLICVKLVLPISVAGFWSITVVYEELS